MENNRTETNPFLDKGQKLRQLREMLRSGTFMQESNVSPNAIDLLAGLSKALPPKLMREPDSMLVSEAILALVKEAESEGN